MSRFYWNAKYQNINIANLYVMMKKGDESTCGQFVNGKRIIGLNDVDYNELSVGKMSSSSGAGGGPNNRRTVVSRLCCTQMGEGAKTTVLCHILISCCGAMSPVHVSLCCSK